jgi:hypothetical protein
MNGSHFLVGLLAAVLVGVGFWIGSQSTDHDVGESGPPLEPSQPQAPRPGPATLGGHDMDVVRRHIADLEARVAKLETELAAKSKAIEPLLGMVEQARRLGIPLETVGPDMESVELPEGSGFVDGPGLEGSAVRKVASDLGLDGRRKKAFEGSVEGILEELRILEKQHAQVVVDGDTTTITIPKYPGGDQARRKWEDWSRNFFTDEERARLERDRATNRLFGHRLGEQARTIRIKESGGTINVTESTTADDGDRMQTEMRGPAAVREMVLEPYMHLLK